MGDHRYSRCRGCGKKAAEVGELSWTRLCVPCAKAAVAENVDGLATMSGPAVSRWRRGMAASVGAVILDDATATGHTGS